MIKSIKYFIALFSIITICTFNQANASSNINSASLHKMRTSMYSILEALNMYTNTQGDNRYQRQIQKNIGLFEAELNKLSSTDTSISNQFSAISQEWKAHKKLISENKKSFIEDGYGNTRLMTKIFINTVKSDKQLKEIFQYTADKNQTKAAKTIKQAQEMAIIIHTLSTEYIVFTTSAYTGAMPAEINANGMDTQIKRFNKLLANLQTASQGNPTASKITKQITTKWEFIRKPIINYFENAVPYIINSYGNRITQDLEKITLEFSK